MRADVTAADGPHTAGGLMWPIIAAVALCDQATKWVMLSFLGRYPDPHGYPVIPDLFFFRLKTNTGVAFSMFEQHPEILTIVTTGAILIIGSWAWSIPREDRMGRTAFAMILGGALGNLIDRYLRGHVIDFLDFVFPGFLGRLHARFFGSDHFATFNLADSAIFLGMVLLLLGLLTHRHPAPADEAAPGGPAETPVT